MRRRRRDVVLIFQEIDASSNLFCAHSTYRVKSYVPINRSTHVSSIFPYTYQPPRNRHPLAGRPDSAPPPPPTHEPNSDFGQGFALRAMGPQHTPALAHNVLKPQAIARRRASRKGTHRFAPVCTGLHQFAPVCTGLHTTRDKHHSCTVGLWLIPGGLVRSHLRRWGASLRLAAHHACQPGPARAVILINREFVIPPVAGTFGPSGKMAADDYGGIAVPDDEPTMPNGAQGSGRIPPQVRKPPSWPRSWANSSL
jgi:hypothetical protein